MLKSILAATLAATALLAQGRSTSEVPVSVVRVAAAADLRFVLDELSSQLARRSRPIHVQATYGSSGTLHAQLRQRAPFDVFLSADVSYPESLVAEGVGDRRDLFMYATGRIVIWVPTGSTVPIERQGMRALATVRRIAIANPEHAPYGRAAAAALRTAGVWDAVKGRLLLGENIAQAAQFVQTGGAEVGIIAKSLAVALAMRAAGRFDDVPQDSYPPILQGGIILPWAASREAAVALRDALVSPEGRKLLTDYGFAVPGR